MGKKFYITTTLPYVNADPHIGFALEIVQADVVARFEKEKGKEVFFNFGTDEHGQKIFKKTLEEGKDPQKYCDEYAEKFNDLKKALDLSYNSFVRTTDKNHIEAAQEFWKRCFKNGYIYKKKYQAKYCVGCELEKTDSELENNRCPLHPDSELETINEENYFFKFSQFQEKLLKLYDKNPDFVVPETRFKEIKSFVKSGLKDFSISRLKKKVPWGIDVPGDPEQVIYVWFDALINYISALGWPENEKKFKDFWPGIQVAGKDNLRQQTAIWQAMLLSLNLPVSKRVFIHGFITINGQKISKSLKNTVSPYELVEKYSTDALRYFLLAKIHPYEDSDFTFQKFEEAYNADLANGLGNLVSRVAKLCEKNSIGFSKEKKKKENRLSPQIEKHLDRFKFNEALEHIWKHVSLLDSYLDSQKPWLKKKNENIEILTEIVKGSGKTVSLLEIAQALKPFLPETSKKIVQQFTQEKVKADKPLFPRIQVKNV